MHTVVTPGQGDARLPDRRSRFSDHRNQAQADPVNPAELFIARQNPTLSSLICFGHDATSPYSQYDNCENKESTHVASVVVRVGGSNPQRD